MRRSPWSEPVKKETRKILFPKKEKKNRLRDSKSTFMSFCCADAVPHLPVFSSLFPWHPIPSHQLQGLEWGTLCHTNTQRGRNDGIYPLQGEMGEGQMAFQHFYVVLDFSSPLPWVCLVLYGHLMEVPCGADSEPRALSAAPETLLRPLKTQGEGRFTFPSDFFQPKWLKARVTKGLKIQRSAVLHRDFLFKEKKNNKKIRLFFFSHCLAWDRMSRGLGVRGNCGGTHVPALFTQEQAQLGWTLPRWCLCQRRVRAKSCSMWVCLLQPLAAMEGFVSPAASIKDLLPFPTVLLTPNLWLLHEATFSSKRSY